MKKISDKTIGRLSLYRFYLDSLRREGTSEVYSHELAHVADCSAAQVRRDIMSLPYSGSPARGYQVDLLINAIETFLGLPANTQVALIGVGHLGRAILEYFRGRHHKLTLVAAFDINQNKIGRNILGCPIYPMEELHGYLRQHRIQVAILCVPASAAQKVAEQLAAAGIKGLLNFAPVRLQNLPGIYIEHVDMAMCLEKVAFFSRRQAE